MACSHHRSPTIPARFSVSGYVVALLNEWGTLLNRGMFSCEWGHRFATVVDFQTVLKFSLVVYCLLLHLTVGEFLLDKIEKLP